MHVYRIFGVTLESDFPLPELTKTTRFDGCPSEKIFLRKSNFRFEIPRREWILSRGLAYWMSPSCRFGIVRSPLAGDFKVDFFKRVIDWSPSQKKSPRLANTLASGKVLGFLLSHLQSSIVLHASVLALGGKAVGFLGPSGVGKSTLAASFLNQGHPLLSDDLAVIRKREDHFLLQPGPPTIRLWPETDRRLNRFHLNGDRVYPETEKKLFRLGHGMPWRFLSKPIVLGSLYFLARKRRGGIQIERLAQKEALIDLHCNLYNQVVEAPKVRERQFKIAAELVQKVPVKRLVYSTGFAHLTRVRQAILKDLNHRRNK